MMANRRIASIKCIDLSNPNIHESVAAIKEACMDTGFFYIINHGISEEFRNEMFAQSKKLFALPNSEKKKLGSDNRFIGYHRHSEFEDAEIYGAGGIVLEADTTNVWPSADVLPGWKETMQKYCRKALDVGREVAKLIATALDLDSDFFNQPNMIGEACQLSILHYGAQNIDDPTMEIKGTRAHSDHGLVTLLMTDDVWGLKICKDKNANPQIWECVPPLKGSIIVNLGDMLETLSNGSFRATMHKVEYCQDRYSFAFFIVLNLDAVLEVLPTSTSKENPPKNLLYKNLLVGKDNDVKDALQLHALMSQARMSTTSQDVRFKGKSGGRVFAPYSVYKGKSVFSVDPVPPTFMKTDSGFLRVKRKGVILLTFWPAIGERKYEWEKRQNFALSLESLITLSPKDSSEFFHDPGMLSSNAGQVRKSLSIKALADGNGYFISLSYFSDVVNNILKTTERIVVPVTAAEQ